jgi:hypothetical protein
MGEMFGGYRCYVYLCVDALEFGGYGYTVPTLRPPNKGTDNFIKKQYKLGISPVK